MKNRKKKLIISTLSIAVLLLMVLGVTYAVYTYSKAGTQTNQLTTGTITMAYTEATNGISITDALPLSDAEGKLLKESTEGNVFDFTVAVNITGRQAVSFEITAEKDNNSTLSNNDVKLYLERSLDGTSYTEVMAPRHFTPISTNTGNDSYGAKNSEMMMDTDTVSESITYYYRLRLWVDENYSMDGTARHFTVTVNVYGKDGVYTEPMVKTYTVGEAINYNPEANALCEIPTSTTGTKTGCMKWYVIKDNGNSVDVLLDHNTTAKVAWNSESTNTEMKEVATALTADTSSWTSGLNPRLISANEIAAITGNTGWDSATLTSTKPYYFGSNSDINYSAQTEEQKAKQRSFAWLFDYTRGCMSNGCNIEDSSIYGYWTSSPVSIDSTGAWVVSFFGSLGMNFVYIDSGFGVRPVITINKSILN